MIKLIEQLFCHPRINFIIVRYLTTAWIALELFIFARLLGPTTFGQYALALQVVGLMTLVGAGSGAGYIYAYYKEQESNIEEIYLVGSIFQYCLGSAILLILSSFFQSYLVLSSVLLIIKIPYLVSEPMLRVHNQFTLPAIGKASGSILTTLLIFIYLLCGSIPVSYNTQIAINSAILITLLGNIFGHLAYYFYLNFSKSFTIKAKFLGYKNISRKLMSYWNLIIAPSWLYTASTILFVSYTFVDRIFLEFFYSDIELSIYALAWQIAQSVLLILTSLNIISGVRIGESQSQNPTELVKIANWQLKVSAQAGLLALVVALLSSWILSVSLYHDYEGLFSAAAIISFGYLTFGVAGSITMVLFFEKKLLEICLAYSFLLFISILGNWAAILFNLNYIFPILFSSLALSFTGILLILRYYQISKKYFTIYD
jgi:O-antigen/teichoic acid export membrane protein